MSEDVALPTSPVVEPLPPGTRLIHIGPPKTGSTALQTALHRHREALAGHGVAYPGGGRKMSGQLGLRHNAAHEALDVGDLESWQRLVSAVEAAGASDGVRVVVVSREGLARMSEQRVEELLRDVGGPEPHVLATARRLDRLLPSYWQQRVKRVGLPLELDDYVRGVLDADAAGPGAAPDPDAAVQPEESDGFWAAYDLPALVRRWAEATGPGRFTLLVPPSGDRDLLPDGVADLLGVPRDLTRDPVGVANDSLTRAEVEAVRRLNQRAHAEGWSRSRRNAFVRESVVRPLVLADTPAGQERIPPMSAENLDRVRALAADQVAQLAALRSSHGLRIVGDLDALLVPVSAPTGDDVGPVPEMLPLDSAGAALEAAVVMAVRRLDVLSGGELMSAGPTAGAGAADGEDD